jgi:hypothetical protein
MPLASLIKLCGTRRRESELNNNEQIININYQYVEFSINDNNFKD